MTEDNTSLVDPQELIRKQISSMNKRITHGSESKIGTIRVTQDKKFVITDSEDEETKVEGPIEVVVLDFINQNNFYKNPFKKGSNDSPDCFAVGWNIEDLAPDPKVVEDPVHPTCAGCPMAEWGSGPNGGKACKNRRKVALKLTNGSKEIFLLSISPTGVAAFDALMEELSEKNVAPSQVVMNLFFDPKVDWAKAMFSISKPNDNFDADVRSLPDAQKILSYVPRPKEEEDDG